MDDMTRKIPKLSFTDGEGGRTAIQSLRPDVPAPRERPLDDVDEIVDEVIEEVAKVVYARMSAGKPWTTWELLNPRDRNVWRTDAKFVVAAVVRVASK